MLLFRVKCLVKWKLEWKPDHKCTAVRTILYTQDKWASIFETETNNCHQMRRFKSTIAMMTLNINAFTAHVKSNWRQNQNYLRVTRPNDNHSPGPVIWDVRPYPLQERTNLSLRIDCIFSSRNERICKRIRISNSMGETALLNISISKGGLIRQRMMVPDMPSWGDKAIRRYTGCTLQTFVKSLLSQYLSTFISENPTLVVLECQFHMCSYLLQI